MKQELAQDIALMRYSMISPLIVVDRLQLTGQIF